MKGDAYLLTFACVLSFCGICFAVGLRGGAVAMLALGVACKYRSIRRMAKPVALWVNAWRFKCSEDDAAHFNSQRLNLSAHESRERVRQRKLQAQRDRINQW